ncbi:hypothetical protein [Comamonas sp. JC664]|uniref:hypothetical protein n=1 Tax=Comamonas sp. JC664 TaxID=2801917 RepID=UPI0036161CC4
MQPGWPGPPVDSTHSPSSTQRTGSAASASPALVFGSSGPAAPGQLAFQRRVLVGKSLDLKAID